MSEDEPRIHVQACLAELHSELCRLGVRARGDRDRQGRPCLEVYDRWMRRRRVYVYPQLFWFLWGERPRERHSVFQAPETARLIQREALGPGWPGDEEQSDIAHLLDRYFR